MLKRFKKFLWIIRESVRQWRIILFRYEVFLRNNRYENQFVKSYGYLPEGIEFTDLKILSLSSTSRLGKENRLLLSKTLYPCSEKKSIISLGDYCWTGRNVEINVLSGTQVIIKSYTSIQDYCKIIGDVIIEKYCLVAPSVFISSGKHYVEKDSTEIVRNQDELHLADKDLIKKHSKRIHIEEDCWLGFSSFIKPGVYIGRGAVIGANSIITKDVLPYTIIGGTNNVLGLRVKFAPPTKIASSNFHDLPYFYRGFLQKRDEQKDQTGKALILGSDTGVVMLKKGTLENFYLSGKCLESNQVKVKIIVIYNGQFRYSAELPSIGIDFELKLNRREFEPLAFATDDDVLRFTNSMNIFQVTCTNLLQASNQAQSIVAFTSFEEDIVD